MKSLIAALVLSAVAVANGSNIFSWSGGGATANWSDSGNWGFAGVPANGDTVVFPAAQPKPSNTNNLANLTLAQIRFAGAGGGYTIYGNAVTVTGGIDAANTAGANLINLGITFGAADFPINVAAGTSLTLSGMLQGSVGLIKNGTGTLMYAYGGNNPYSGTTHVNAGSLLLNVGGVNAFSGPLVIGDGSGSGNPTVQLEQSIEMPDTQPVTVNLHGLLDLNNFNDTVGALMIQGATVSSGSGTLALNGDLTVLGSGVEPMITGNLRFLGGLHTVSVEDGATFRDLDLLANVSDAGGGLWFTSPLPGNTFARLTGNNSFTGPLTVDNMTLSVETPTALGTTSAGTSVGNHATLFLYSTGITNEPLTMAVGATLYGQDDCVWAGPILLNGDVTIGCYPSVSTLMLSGVISGSGGFEKVDVGTLELFGNAGNTYTGNTWIQSGNCLLDKASGAAIPTGTLTMSDHFGTPATVRDINVGFNLGTTVALAVNEGGWLDLNGEVESISPVTLSGGKISTDAGRLQINADVTTLGSTNNAYLYGNILFNGPRNITVNHGYAPGGWDLLVPGTLGDSGAGFQIVGGLSNTWPGTAEIRLMGSNSFSGPLTISGANVDAETPWSLGTTSSGTFLTNAGYLSVYDVGITNETVTLAAGTTLAGEWAGTDAVWDGPIVLTGDATLQGFNLYGYFDVLGAISGTGNLTVEIDGGFVRFAGPLANTYVGTTTVVPGTTLTGNLLLGRSGVGNSIPGPLIISSNCVVQELADWQINSPTKPVMIQETGVLDLTNHNDWIGPLTLQGAQMTSTSGVLYLGGDINVNSSTVAMSTIAGNATLWNGTRTINTIGHNYSPDLRITANLGGNGSSGLIKTGAGEASLAGPNNTFPGPVTVNGGTLWAAANNAFGNTNTPATVNNDANIFLLGNTTIGLKPLILASPGSGQGALTAGFGSGHWGGDITLTVGSVVDVYTNSTLELSGAITGPGNLTKIDWGNLILDGAISNNYAGTTLLQQGTLTLSKTNGPAISGPLTIGLGLDAPNSDVVRTVLGNQFSLSNVVNISSSGLLDVSGLSSGVNKVGSLTGPGPIQLGANDLYCGYDNTSTTFAGAINGTASGTFVKTGISTLTLTGSSGFPGIMQVQGGKLFVNGSMPSTVASFINGAVLGGSGTVGSIGFNQGILAPGNNNNPGILNINSTGVTLNNNDTFLITLNGTTAGSGYGQLNVTGTVGLGNANLLLNMLVPGSTNSQYTIINNDGADAVTGTFGGLPEGATVMASNGAKFRITYHGGTGNDVVLTQTSTPTAPYFTVIQKLGNGTIQLYALGQSNLTYSVQANPDLGTTNWDTIGTAPANSAGGISFTDLTATNYTQKFYRLSWP